MCFRFFQIINLGKYVLVQQQLIKDYESNKEKGLSIRKFFFILITDWVLPFMLYEQWHSEIRGWGTSC